jgi:hypothetical protein
MHLLVGGTAVRACRTRLKSITALQRVKKVLPRDHRGLLAGLFDIWFFHRY